MVITSIFFLLFHAHWFVRMAENGFGTLRMHRGKGTSLQQWVRQIVRGQQDLAVAGLLVKVTHGVAGPLGEQLQSARVSGLRPRQVAPLPAGTADDALLRAASRHGGRSLPGRGALLRLLHVALLR